MWNVGCILLVFASILQAEVRPETLPQLSMLPERRASDEESHPRYFNEVERKKFELQYEGGQFLDYKGRPFNTSTPQIYVVSPEGKFYSIGRDSLIDGRHANKTLLYHSSFLAGGPVLMAGLAEFDNGQLIYIDNESGHYAPKPDAFYNFLENMQREGFDFSRVSYRSFLEGPTDPTDSHHVSRAGIFRMPRKKIDCVSPFTKAGD